MAITWTKRRGRKEDAFVWGGTTKKRKWRAAWFGLRGQKKGDLRRKRSARGERGNEDAQVTNARGEKERRRRRAPQHTQSRGQGVSNRS